MRYTKPLKKILQSSTRSLLSEIFRRHFTPQAGQQINSEHPIFLMHGFMGGATLDIPGFNLFSYFNDLAVMLQQVGYSVYCPEIRALEAPDSRAASWAEHLEKILQQTGAKKVHIIAHGQGAIDARILACRRAATCSSVQGKTLTGQGFDHRIASITSLGGPHLGTPIFENPETKAATRTINDLLDFIALLNRTRRKQVDKCMENLSRDYMIKVFNPAMQLPANIPCYTVAANPINSDAMSQILDRGFKEINDMAEFDGGGSNDGLIPVRSALFEGNDTLLAGTDRKQWQPLGQVSTDHLGMIGSSDAYMKDFNYLSLFVGLVQNIDQGYKPHTRMALQTNGHWQRIQPERASHMTFFPQNKTTTV